MQATRGRSVGEWAEFFDSALKSSDQILATLGSLGELCNRLDVNPDVRKAVGIERNNLRRVRARGGAQPGPCCFFDIFAADRADFALDLREDDVRDEAPGVFALTR